MTASKSSLRKQNASVVTDPSTPFVTLPPQTPKPPDPARLAVAQMLSHTLARAGATLAQAGADGMVTVILLPSAAWSDVATKEWTVTARKGSDAEDGFGDRYWHRCDWTCWAPVVLERRSALDAAADKFARVVAKGRHCAAFTPDLSWLPSELVEGADYHLALLPLTAADVLTVAEALAGDVPTETISAEQAAALTPRLLRLARRPSQTADAYIRKLRILLKPSATEVKVAELSFVPVREGPTLDRLHGMTEAIVWGMNLAKDLEQYKQGQLPWSAVDRGLLLSGPPGCGKTLFARALATTCALPLVSGAYGQWLGTGSGHQGDLLRAMRKTFADARSSAPSVIFIDEVDSFPNRSTITHHHADWEIQVVNALLAEIDGVESREGVVLVAACNHPDKLDPALIRSGRLDRHIRIALPDRPALAAIFREHLGEELPGEDLLAVALAAIGSTGADCERLVRGARRRARNADRLLILEDLMNEVDGVDNRTDAELQVAAVHEAGHALALYEFWPNAVSSISLTGGGGQTLADTRQVYLSARDVRHRLIVILAGRAAEDIILGIPSSAAGGDQLSDLAHATKLVVGAATAFGLDASLGLLWLGLPDDANLPQLLQQHPALAERVRTVTTEAYADALTLIRRRSTAVRDVAVMLLKKRALSGEDLDTLLTSYLAAPDAGATL